MYNISEELKKLIYVNNVSPVSAFLLLSMKGDIISEYSKLQSAVPNDVSTAIYESTIYAK